MKYFKLFLTVCAMAVAISASAQSKTTAKSKTAAPAKTTTAAPAKKAATTTAKPATTTAKPATTTTAKATTKTTASATTTSVAASGDFDPRPRFFIEAKIGKFYGPHGGFGFNFGLEKEFNKYFAVDFFSIDFATNFTNDSFRWFPIGIKAGARGFTPSWSNGKMRGYGSLAVGYECGIIRGGDYYKTSCDHAFALSAGAGVQFARHFSIGYDLEYHAKESWGVAHYAKFGYKF